MDTLQLHPNLRADHNASGFTEVNSAEMRHACNRFLRNRGLQGADHYREDKDQIRERKLLQTKAPSRPRK